MEQTTDMPGAAPPGAGASAGLPDGVLNALTGRERDMSPALLGHPEPVLAVCRADGFDEAVELTNDFPYGLSAAVFTSDPRSPGLRCYTRIKTATVRFAW